MDGNNSVVYTIYFIMEENWKWIDGYEGLYKISNFGRVCSYWYNNIRLLKLHKINGGYYQVQLTNTQGCKSYLIHRLVAQAFIKNPNNYNQINHIDEDKSNNRADNLEWCDSKYNSNYGTRTKRIIEQTTNGKLSKPIIQYDKNMNFVDEFPSISDAQRKLHIKHISDVCLYKRNYCGGYIWRFKEKDD